MNTSKDLVIEKLKKWAEVEETVLASILTSSRANASSNVDELSDYDVALYVRDSSKYLNDDWLTTFGDVLIKWPEQPQTTFDKNWITRLVLFQNKTRIDFQITTNALIPPSDYDFGYQVLVDKENIATNFPKATLSEQIIKKPTQAEFATLINDYYWDSTYVIKNIIRGDLFYAKYMFDSVMRFEYFEKMIEWYIGSANSWSVGTNKHGRDFQKYLDQSTWDEIQQTFAGADLQQTKTAFYKMNELFNRLAKFVAKDLNYKFPDDLVEHMNRYFSSVNK